MKAMVLNKTGSILQNPEPLTMTDLPIPEPGNQEILIRVSACGVCHTELDEIEGRMPPPTLPVVLGHQVVGTIVKTGEDPQMLKPGDRVGVAWIYSSCGVCIYCKSGKENLCAYFRATGRDANGGYAEFMTVPSAYAYPIPTAFSDVEAAPLLCAGAIGYRSLRLANIQDGQYIGLTGFGASAHLVMKMAKYQYPSLKVFVFARSENEQAFARELGADWAGDTEEASPELCDSIIDTTPVWKPVVEAMRCLAPGGRLVINAIRKESYDQESLLKLNYPQHVWMEKEIKSVANVTRTDVSEFLTLAASIPIRPEVQEYPLEKANQALQELKARKIRGAKVLTL
jgi:alcohol dehydrogenase, propanol-preferring